MISSSTIPGTNILINVNNARKQLYFDCEYVLFVALLKLLEQSILPSHSKHIFRDKTQFEAERAVKKFHLRVSKIDWIKISHFAFAHKRKD